ncbi:MAG: PTS sugar transporter subunit IIA, partial [Phycisphaerales bacterium]
MKMLDIVAREAVVARVESTTRDGVIQELVGALIAAGRADEAMRSDLIAKVLDRERRGSTGFGKGVAVPHVKHPEVERMAAAVGISETGVD